MLNGIVLIRISESKTRLINLLVFLRHRKKLMSAVAVLIQFCVVLLCIVEKRILGPRISFSPITHYSRNWRIQMHQS